jgi:hypothetical protein
MTRLIKKLLLPAFVVCLGFIAFAGSGGITVPNGTYTFVKDPGGATVGSGQFVGGSPNTMFLNPGPNSTRYTQDASTGKYNRNNNSHDSMCFHSVDGGVTWDNKYDGVITSSGHLTP